MPYTLPGQITFYTLGIFGCIIQLRHQLYFNRIDRHRQFTQQDNITLSVVDVITLFYFYNMY